MEYISNNKYKLKWTTLVIALILVNNPALARSAKPDKTVQAEQANNVPSNNSDNKDSNNNLDNSYRQFMQDVEDDLWTSWSSVWNKKPKKLGFSKHSRVNYSVDDKQQEYILSIDIPGFDKEQVKLELQNNYLIVNAKAQNSQDNSNSNTNARNSFYQKFYLPKDVDQDKITSSLKNGVLTVIIPKVPAKAVEVKTVPVN